jgi:hypothetical protein
MTYEIGSCHVPMLSHLDCVLEAIGTAAALSERQTNPVRSQRQRKTNGSGAGSLIAFVTDSEQLHSLVVEVSKPLTSDDSSRVRNRSASRPAAGGPLTAACVLPRQERAHPFSCAGARSRRPSGNVVTAGWVSVSDAQKRSGRG